MADFFWLVIYDDNKQTMEVIGISSNDILLTDNVFAMQQVGMNVRCQAVNTSTPKERINVPGFAYENDLYSRLLMEYEIKTQKQLKRW